MNGNSARSAQIRTIYRTNSAPELNRPIATRTNSHGVKPIASTTKTRTYLRSNVARRLSDDLNEALLSTRSEHLSPTRDGYYASVNKVLARYGVGIVLGPALGVGAVEIYNRAAAALETTTTTTTPTSTTPEENMHLLHK